MKMQMLLIVALSFLAVGCASSDKSKNQSKEKYSAAAKKAGYRCEKTIKIGSHIGHKRCTTKAQRDREKEEAQNTMNSIQGGGPKKTGDSF